MKKYFLALLIVPMNDIQIKLKIKIQHFLSCNADSTQHIKKRKLQEAASKSEDYLPQPVLLVLKDF